ncbi:MAG: hypothetical protein CM15mP18_2030 [Methanobacteriota archaeon]|nr:MAG: hypothetical protein CM15mP18_2030 [Euryarchaeota archaeon]
MLKCRKPRFTHESDADGPARVQSGLRDPEVGRTRTRPRRLGRTACQTPAGRGGGIPQALADGDLVEVLDALADIGYILAGSVINHGLHGLYDEAFAEVHRSNMAKLVDGKVLRRQDGKVMKPRAGRHPNLASSLQSTWRSRREPSRGAGHRWRAGHRSRRLHALGQDGYDVLLTYTTSSRPAEFVVDAIREAGGDALAVKIDCAAEDEVALLASHPWMARTVDAWC